MGKQAECTLGKIIGQGSQRTWNSSQGAFPTELNENIGRTVMELSKKNNPKLFFIYLGVVLVCVLSLFLHLIYFDLIVLTAVTFVIWIILALISQAVLPSNRLVKTGN